MTSGFLSAVIIAPLLLAVAGGFVYWYTAQQDRHDLSGRGR